MNNKSYGRGRGEPPGDAARKVGMYTMIPTMMVVGPLLGYFGGSWLEGRIGGAPWWSFAGLVLGTTASVRQIILIFKRASTRSKDADSRHG